MMRPERDYPEDTGSTPTYPHPTLRCDLERAILDDDTPASMGRLRYYVDDKEVTPAVYTETAHRYGLVPSGVTFDREWVECFPLTGEHGR